MFVIAIFEFRLVLQLLPEQYHHKVMFQIWHWRNINFQVDDVLLEICDCDAFEAVVTTPSKKRSTKNSGDTDETTKGLAFVVRETGRSGW